MSKLVTIPIGSPYIPQNGDIGTYSNYVANEGLPFASVIRTFEINDITITRIRQVLGNPVDAQGNPITDVSLLCSHANINMWALFKPNKVSPFRIGDFAGYNHTAGAPTHFIGKTTIMTFNLNINKTFDIPFLLNRGERPPSWTNPATTWDLVKVSILTLSGDLSVNTYKVATVYGESVGNTTPQHIISITPPTNDYYSFVISVIAHYVNTGYGNEAVIEDTHPNITINVSPYFIYKTLNTSEMSSSATIRHRYEYTAGEPQFVYDSAIIYIDNLDAPSISMVPSTYPNTIANTIQYNGNTLPYATTEFNRMGVWKTLSMYKGSGNTVGMEYKANDIWYKISSIQSGYLGFHR